jgi:hypothetical protein
MRRSDPVSGLKLGEGVAVDPPTLAPAREEPSVTPTERQNDSVSTEPQPLIGAQPNRHTPSPSAPAPQTARVIWPGEFDPGAVLRSVGIEPLRAVIPPLDVDRLLRAGARGRRVTFKYPNAADPARPTIVTLVPFSAYAPAGSSKPRPIADPRVAAWLTAREPGTANNFEDSDMAAVRRLVEDYVRGHAGALAALGIHDVRHMTVAQAATLAGLMTIERSTYNDSALGYEGSATFHPALQAGLARLRRLDPELAARQEAGDVAPAGVQLMDSLGVETFLANKAAAEDGVCRNYCETFQAVWTTLQDMQRPEKSKLASTYVKFPMGDFHIWPALYTVEADGSIIGTQLDPTWGDTKTGAPDPTRIVKDLSEDGDGIPYALGRARFAVQDMHLGVNGTAKSAILTDYYTVWLVAHDLAARGKADDGARLLLRFLNDLPPVTREDLTYWTEKGLVDAAGKKAAWRRPGAVELANALRARLKPETVPNS